MNIEAFLIKLESWQLFYATVAAASATLTGLLFVSLSLNRERLKGARARSVLGLSRRTFGDFLYILMMALVFIVPHQVPYSLTTALLVLGLSRGIGLLRQVRHHTHAKSGRLGLRLVVREIGLPFIATIGLMIVAVLIAFGVYDAIYGLVVVIAALLVSACWNAWLLLIEE